MLITILLLADLWSQAFNPTQIGMIKWRANVTIAKAKFLVVSFLRTFHLLPWLEVRPLVHWLHPVVSIYKLGSLNQPEIRCSLSSFSSYLLEKEVWLYLLHLLLNKAYVRLFRLRWLLCWLAVFFVKEILEVRVDLIVVYSLYILVLPEYVSFVHPQWLSVADFFWVVPLRVSCGIAFIQACF